MGTIDFDARFYYTSEHETHYLSGVIGKTKYNYRQIVKGEASPFTEFLLENFVKRLGKVQSLPEASKSIVKYNLIEKEKKIFISFWISDREPLTLIEKWAVIPNTSIDISEESLKEEKFDEGQKHLIKNALGDSSYLCTMNLDTIMKIGSIDIWIFLLNFLLGNLSQKKLDEFLDADFISIKLEDREPKDLIKYSILSVKGIDLGIKKRRENYLLSIMNETGEYKHLYILKDKWKCNNILVKEDIL